MRLSLAPFSFLVLLLGAGGCRVPEPAAVAGRVHDRALVVDSHIDTPLRMVRQGWNPAERHRSGVRGGSQYDLPRMVEGGVDGAFFAVFTGQRERTPAGYDRVRRRADRLLEALHRMCREHPRLCGLALSPADAERLHSQGRRAIFIGMENGYPLGRDLSRVAHYYRRGVRYITLCHVKNNDLCDSSTDENGEEHRGLSSLGRQVVAEMNRLGMIVDVSHISDRSFFDVLQLSRAPVIASHSSCRALCDHPRNLSDPMLLALAAQGGVIQICALGSYLKELPPNTPFEEAWQKVQEKYGRWEEADEKRREILRGEYYALKRKHPDPQATVKDLVDHVDHVKGLVGVDHVGIGTDMDGGGGLADLPDAAAMPAVTAELVRRGYTEEEIFKIWGGNLMRVFRAVEKAAKGGE